MQRGLERALCLNSRMRQIEGDLGNPQAGTPLKQGRQTIGRDLPLRVLVWEDVEGKVWLTYRQVQSLARYHRVTGHDEAV